MNRRKFLGMAAATTVVGVAGDKLVQIATPRVDSLIVKPHMEDAARRVLKNKDLYYRMVHSTDPNDRVWGLGKDEMHL
jgi:hypothetical protein